MDDANTRGRGSEGENGGENGAQVEVPSRARSRAMSIQRSEESSLSLDFTSIILYSNGQLYLASLSGIVPKQPGAK